VSCAEGAGICAGCATKREIAKNFCNLRSAHGYAQKAQHGWNFCNMRMMHSCSAKCANLNQWTPTTQALRRRRKLGAKCASSNCVFFKRQDVAPLRGSIIFTKTDIVEHYSLSRSSFENLFEDWWWLPLKICA
jgi:hypothetical protein